MANRIYGSARLIKLDDDGTPTGEFTGLTVDVIAAHTADELLAFHEVDHRHCATSYLGHTHTSTLPPPEAPTDDRRIHEAMLKAVKAGKRVANLDEILDRARQASIRRMAATTDPATGARIPGAGRLSQADLDALEIAQALAERTARRQRRQTKGGPRG